MSPGATFPSWRRKPTPWVKRASSAAITAITAAAITGGGGAGAAAIDSVGRCSAPY